jgi:hypothetical protein
MPNQAVAVVVSLGVDAVHVPHQARQIGLARVQHEVKVVSHQAIGQHLGIEALHRLLDDGELRQPVSVIKIDRLAAVTSGGDVVDGAGELDAKGAAHAKKVL